MGDHYRGVYVKGFFNSLELVMHVKIGCGYVHKEHYLCSLFARYSGINPHPECSCMVVGAYNKYGSPEFYIEFLALDSIFHFGAVWVGEVVIKI